MTITTIFSHKFVKISCINLYILIFLSDRNSRISELIWWQARVIMVWGQAGTRSARFYTIPIITPPHTGTDISMHVRVHQCINQRSVYSLTESDGVRRRLMGLHYHGTRPCAKPWEGGGGSLKSHQTESTAVAVVLFIHKQSTVNLKCITFNTNSITGVGLYTRG